MAVKKNFKNIGTEAASKFINTEEIDSNNAYEVKPIVTPTEIDKESVQNSDNKALSKEELVNIYKSSEAELNIDEDKSKERLSLILLSEEIEYINIMMRLDGVKFITRYLKKLIQEDKNRRIEEYKLALNLFKN